MVGLDPLIHQAGLPHPGLAHDGHDLTVASAGLRERLAQGGAFRLAPHKAGEAPRGGSLEAAAQRAGPDQLVHLHRLGHPPDRYCSQRLYPYQALDQPQGRRRQANRPWRRQLLHARRQVRGLAHCRVVHMQVVTDSPHHYISGVEADAQLYFQALGAAHRLGVAPQLGLHRQSGVAGA